VGAGPFFPYFYSVFCLLAACSHSAARGMVRHAGEFGLPPVARSRLALGAGGQPGAGKFDGLPG